VVDPKRRFGDNVRRLRQAAGMSQERLGFASDLHPTEISRLERAVREPRLGTIVRVARALGVPASELLEGIE
jgi:transcriptional regulator with XRE-family HTH domain